MIILICFLAIAICLGAGIAFLCHMNRLAEPPVCRICGGGIKLNYKDQARCEFCGEPFESDEPGI